VPSLPDKPSQVDSTRPWLWYTIGPATVDGLGQTLRAGATGIRHTLSYGTPELHIQRARQARSLAAGLGLRVYSIADLPGEKPRLGSFLGEVVRVSAGDRIGLGAADAADVWAAIPVLPLQNDNFLEGAVPGATVIVGDGGVELRVLEAAVGGVVISEVVRGGAIENNRGLTLVDGGYEPRALTSTDMEMLDVVLSSGGFDAVALSFVSDPEDLKTVREIIAGRPVAVVAKIETRRGVDRVEEICELADIVMAARGDLALAVGPAMLYAAVSHIAGAAYTAGVPWVLATQLLEGLDQFGYPTRAELTDTCGWLERGAAGAMLSRETVFGGHALESIRLLRSLLDAPRTWEVG